MLPALASNASTRSFGSDSCIAKTAGILDTRLHSSAAAVLYEPHYELGARVSPGLIEQARDHAICSTPERSVSVHILSNLVLAAYIWSGSAEGCAATHEMQVAATAEAVAMY